MSKMLKEISDFILTCERDFDIKIIYQNKIKKHHLKKLLLKMKKVAKEEGIVFVHGKGKRKTWIYVNILDIKNRNFS